MGIGDAASTGLAAIAWVVAGALALALGSVVFGIGAYRRSREAEARLRRLEAAVGEFCGALRDRLDLARSGAHEVDPCPGRPAASGPAASGPADAVAPRRGEQAA